MTTTETITYRMDPATEAAANEWPLIVCAAIDDQEPGRLEPARVIVALRCATCSQSLGLSAGYAFPLDHVRPLVMAHIIRSHGYAANPVRVAA